MNKIIRIGIALVLATVSAANAKAQDPIAAWNQISETAVKNAGHPPPVAALDFAIVHLAIYDAVESIARRYEPYYTLAPGAIGSPSAAAAKAGHGVLVGLFPLQSQPLDVAYANFLAANGVDPLDPATAVGAQAAANILALRSNDGRFPPCPPHLGAESSSASCARSIPGRFCSDTAAADLNIAVDSGKIQGDIQVTTKAGIEI